MFLILDLILQPILDYQFLSFENNDLDKERIELFKATE